MDSRYGTRGSSGSLLTFLIGVAMLIGGGVLFFRRLLVASSYRVLWGSGGTSFALFGLLAGVFVLFFTGRGRIGWLLILISAVVIFLNVISNLVIYFAPTSLFQTLIMLGLIFGGLGLIFRGFQRT